MIQLNHNSRTILAAVMQARHDGTPPPSLRELSQRCGFKSYAPNSIYCHVKRMKKLGLLIWEVNKERTLTPTCRFIPAHHLFKENPNGDRNQTQAQESETKEKTIETGLYSRDGTTVDQGAG